MGETSSNSPLCKLVVDADDLDQDVGADVGDNEVAAKPTRFEGETNMTGW